MHSSHLYNYHTASVAQRPRVGPVGARLQPARSSSRYTFFHKHTLAIQPCNLHQLRHSKFPRTSKIHVASERLQSEAEKFVEELEQTAPGSDVLNLEQDNTQLRAKLSNTKQKEAALQKSIDELYHQAFGHLEVVVGEEGTSPLTFPAINEQAFQELGRTSPQVTEALLKEKGRDSAGWLSFQQEVHSLKLTRSRLQKEAQELEATIVEVDREIVRRQKAEEEGPVERLPLKPGQSEVNIVLVTGFESFNVDLYKKAAQQLGRESAFIRLTVFSDRDIEADRGRVERALANADVFFGSLLFDFDQVEWLRARISSIPIRLIFESSLELMSSTQLGGFEMSPTPGKKAGPPPAVKKVLSLFGSGKEEDKMVGYLSFLKIGPKLLKFIPGQKARDLRNWLIVYGYWNQGGMGNVVAMFSHLVDQYFAPVAAGAVRPVVETPATGCLHPEYNGGYFATPVDYMKWYAKEGPLRGTGAPVVAVLLYRKHVITEQPYIPLLIQQMESEGVIPLPVFINGVEAHTIVRDLLTTTHEQQQLASGAIPKSAAPRKDAVVVDAVVSTIGFPLVGGPAGTMEGGRQAEVAKGILTAKNVPYVVAAPLLIQDVDSWSRDGVAGLQSVVLYSLPELDGAIDTVPLGGLVGDNIFLIPERVKRLASRLKKWVELRRKTAAEKKVAILLYGFPPGVGATGTAALLNVPKSLERMLGALREQGYDLGESGTDEPINGEAIITALKAQEDQRVISRGTKGVEKAGAGDAEKFGARAVAAEVPASRLMDMLTYPPEWGPTEWGPIPFLPENDVLVRRMEKQWGNLRNYRGLMTSASGNFLVPGVQLGNVFIGVQPLLGIEGDPMRLLFERDLTPHPQYAAFYQWLQKEYQADVVLHFGMHGTVEWLPGAPLGNTGLSWSDVLLGNLPNVYVYACNNPSESIVAKRRGYGTIVSHNVPPYGRAGLYKQLATLKELVGEYRENPESADALKVPIIENLTQTGLQEDCPFVPAAGPDSEPVMLKSEEADGVSTEAFTEYCSRLYQYLQVVEGRLFSEGLHVLGQGPSNTQLEQYLTAYFGEDLPGDAVEAVVESGTGGIEAVRARLERQWQREQLTQHAEKLEEAVELRGLLAANTEEMDAVLKAMRGEYIQPEAGGDLLRDGPGVLPTGRNIHALDPYRMPSPAALERGIAAAQAILDDHRAKNGGSYPETVAVNLWGLDAIKTKGESVAMVLHLVGARPVREGTGRIARFELVPLEEMGGRPRVDALCNMSGIFRDSFQNVVELLDDLFQRAANADEPEDRNFVRRHAEAMKGQGLDNTSARIFSNPAGDYGSMVNERVGTGGWESGEELGDTWVSRNAYSYGRGKERGTARPEVLQSLLSTTERVVQQIDSVEYGLTDIQEYYANTGALKKAAETARGGRAVGCSIVEAWGKEVQPRELEEVLRLEYRSKLLNPKWAQAMADQGSGGAFEISQRMTAMIGWGATTNFQEDWTWDQAAETYALDPEMADKLRKSNPQAYSNVLKRMLEAAGRGMWNAKPDMLEKLRELYSEMDEELEGVSLSK